MATPAPFTPWYVLGWTAQQPYPQMVPLVNPDVNNLPDDIFKITVTATYVNIVGWLQGGSVIFTQHTPTYDSLTPDTIIMPGRIRGNVEKGILSVDVPAGFTYDVKEIMPGGRRFTTTIPSDMSGVVSINDLISGLVEI